MANQKKSTAPKKRKNTNSVQVEINRVKKREAHAKRHPNDKGVVKGKLRHDEDICSICKGVEKTKFMDYQLVGDRQVCRCRKCRHHPIEHFHNVITFPKGLRKALHKGK